MRAIYKKPGKAAEIIHIEDKLEALQGAVGGYIEVVPVRRDTVIVCNEEGKLMGMPFNFSFRGDDGFRGDAIAGPALFLGVDGENFADIPKDVEMMLMPQLRHCVRR